MVSFVEFRDGEHLDLSDTISRNVVSDGMSSQYDVQYNAFVPLIIPEFAAASKDCPIVFADIKGHIIPFALVHLDFAKGFNSVAGPICNARYVPLLLRERPFDCAGSLGEYHGTGHICITMQPQHGAEDSWLRERLDKTVEFLEFYRKTVVFCKNLALLGLFDKVTVRNFGDNGCAGGSLQFLVVNHERVSALSDRQLGAMIRNGDMHLCSLHLASLGKTDTIIRQMSLRRPPKDAMARYNDGFVPWRERKRSQAYE